MLRKTALAAALVAAWPIAQAADAGGGAPTGAQSGPSNAVAPYQADATLVNSRFPTLWAVQAREFVAWLSAS